MELVSKKLELLKRFKDNEILIKEAIESSNYEYLLKRVEQNDFYIRQIDEINAKLDDNIQSIYDDEVESIAQEITKLHRANLSGINKLMTEFKTQAIKEKQSSRPIKAYVSNMRK